jgi:PAS domain S-box-containing protein
MNAITISVNLLHNAAAVLGVMFVYQVFESRFQCFPRRVLRVLDGVFFGVLALLSMTAPVSTGPGVFFDLRGIVMGLATLYYGPVAGVVTTLMVCGVRLLIGGTGAQTAILIAVTTFLISYIFYRLQKRGGRPLTSPEHALFGAALTLPVYIWSFQLPDAHANQLREQLFVPLLLTHVLASWAMGLLIQYQRHNAQMNEVLEHERDLLRGLIEATPDYIFIKDDQGRFIVSNIAHARAARVPTLEALIGKTAEQVFPPELAAQYRADDEYVLQTSKTLTVERQTVDAEGRPIWVTTIKAPLYNAQKKVIGVIGISRNITERKRAEDQVRQSEARYRQIIETANEGVWIFNNVGECVLVNPHLAAMLGYTDDEMVGKSLHEVFAPDVIDEIYAKVERRQQGVSEQYDSKLVCKDGSTLDVIISASPLFDQEGHYEGALAMVIDISDRKRAEQKEQELVFERERSKTMRRFINNVSHDFRTPLATINTSLYLLRLSSSDPVKQEERFNLIDEQIKRMTTLLDAFTEVGSLGDGSQHVYVQVDVNEMVTQSVEMHQPAAARKQQQLVFKPAANVPSVHGVPEHLQRVLNELLENAVFFTPEGGHIEVRTCTSHNQVVIEVQDDGVGINAEDMPHIFDYFYRVDQARQTDTGGSGLGLSIARAIIDNHRGSLEVESTPGKGSLFRICLPVPPDALPQTHSSLMKWSKP